MPETHSADAVIVVLESDASNVLFELGIAFGLRKPTLVLVKPGDSIPPFAAFTRYLTYTGSVTEILKLGVEGFLARAPPQTDEIRGTPKTADVTGRYRTDFPLFNRRNRKATGATAGAAIARVGA